MPNENPHASKDSEFQTLLQKKKLTNAETAQVLRVVVRRMLAVNENQVSLNNQHTELGNRIDRLEKLILDQPKRGGGVRAGLSRSLQATQQTLGQTQKQLSAIMLSVQTLRRLIPWMLTRQQELGRSLTEDEVIEAGQSIQNQLVKDGEEAVKYWDTAEQVGRQQVRCAGCIHWIEAGIVQAPGVDTSARCEQKFVQLKCPSCGHLHGMPIDPNNPKGDCVKCKTTLVREIDLPEDAGGGRQTMCKSFKPDVKKLRQALAAAEIPQTLIDEIAPLPAAADA